MDFQPSPFVQHVHIEALSCRMKGHCNAVADGTIGLLQHAHHLALISHGLAQL